MTSDSIRFILNGQRTEAAGLPPTTTLLQYLRRQKKLTGTKEGCAEGDCGACTAIVGSLENGKVIYQSLNACIVFLPTLDGKEIITVEQLKSKDGKLHPVQKAMMNCHGAQCGFCTPGFVMSLTALVHNNAKSNEDDIQDAIAGNLCRCTGYRPILDAAKAVYSKGRCSLPSDAAALENLRRDEMFSYETPEGKFFAPVTIDELADVLSRHPDATLLAGGTDVGLWVTKMHRHLTTIIYTANVKELHAIEQKQDSLEIGAATTYTEAFQTLAAYDESLEELLRRLGSLQIRNAGTVGGNIANGSPIGDGMPPLIALGTRIVLRSKTTARTVNLEEYFLDYKKQDLRLGEFISKIIVPAKKDGVLFKTYKVSKRFDQDISAVCTGFLLDIKDGVIVDARLAYGGMAAIPKRALHAEKILRGQPWNEQSLNQAMTALDQDFSPLSDMRASAEYRHTVAKNLLQRFYIDTTDPATATKVYRYAE